ncbi:FtsX-like permease family protein [Ureibacillus sinduriensis]|uniref:ABC transporter permease n=1 Tax=Ureibacillus sinduriensis BLB-1 = JCM 15800 TaxID=1384057 RepID=A0A0A3ILU6_9BACL|nr:ABC transporter permease [Ureibacillus sinduriensis]KGR75787.1 ABC transporter permease [Ureibacillus sinduriensis BLB-1 = JCM 15800]
MTFHQFAYRNVIRNIRIYAAYFMASFFSVFVFFIYSMLMFHPEIEDGFLGNVPIIWMVVAEIILVVFTWFFIFYSMRAFLEARAKEFAILLHLGMERRQLSRLIFLETIIIGSISIILGIIFGYAFSKFFFMIVREILMLEDLPLYLSWEPFLLTIGVYFSAFILISLFSVHFSPERKVIDLLNGYKNIQIDVDFTKAKAILGIVLIVIGYVLALLTTRQTMVVFSVFIPFLIIIGTYLFFTDTTQYFVDRLKGRRLIYWKKSRMLPMAEQTFILKNNGKMFFVMTIVTTLAFLSIGLLATLSSYTSQYDKLNPLGLIYKGHIDNPKERDHISSLISELEDKELSYQLTRFTVLKQTSSFTKFEVEVFKESDINNLLISYGYPMVRLSRGEAMFIPYSKDSIKELAKKRVETVLLENNVKLTIDQVYPQLIFPPSIVSLNSIIISDVDFRRLVKPYSIYPHEEPGYHLFTFDIPQWVEADEVGVALQQEVAEEYLKEEYELPYYFENAGLNYSYILSTYSLFTLVGLLVAAVFLLAAGSFIYFKLHTSLEAEKKKFDVLKRMGISNNELKSLVTKLLLPQFFLPWGVALCHSLFAFFALQNILKNFANVSIVKEVVFAFVFLIILEIIYYNLIRWRYIAHVKE